MRHHIFFAVPAYRGIQCPQFLDSFEATVKECMARGWQTEFAQITASPYVQTARNELVRKFMESGADMLFFLDDDISWSPEDAIKLIEMEDDVVAGIYPLKSERENFPVVIHTDDAHFPIVQECGCISASRVPTGFLRIKRGVISRMIQAYPGQLYIERMEDGTEVTLYDLFPQGVHDKKWIGEDFAFCRLWTDIGGQISVVPDIDFYHYAGNKVWSGNYHEFLLRQPGGSKYEAVAA